MEIISKDVLQSWDKFYRGNFVNSLSGYKSASLIATVNSAGQPNLAVFSNIVHLGADPAMVGFINRPREAAPHTLSNIEAIGKYTINHIHPEFVSQAHQTSAKYDANISEFDAVGLTPQYVDHDTVPFVKESLCSYSMALVEVLPIRHNNTFFVIGSIEKIQYDPSILEEDGFLSLHKINSVTSLGIDAYYTTQPVARLPYAKPSAKKI